MTSRSTVLVLASALAVLPFMAFAQSAPITVQAGEQSEQDRDSFRRIVRYGDLDLASVDGGQLLKARVRAAARDGCTDLYDVQPLAQTFGERRQCMRVSLADAMSRVDRLIQTAARGEKTGEQIAVLILR